MSTSLHNMLLQTRHANMCMCVCACVHVYVLVRAQAFRCMPLSVRTKLAKSCQGLQLPAGAVVFEEDDKGDAMYVVVSGSLQVRARPLPQRQAAGQQGHSTGTTMPQPPAALLLPAEAAAAGAGGQGGRGGTLPPPGGPALQEGAMSRGARRQRALTDCIAVAVGGGGHLDGRKGSCGGNRLVSRPGQLAACRRTTWEGVAFTAKEQGRLEAVRATLLAEEVRDKQLYRLPSVAINLTV